MGLISIDYLDAIRQANKLNNAAEQCEDAQRAANKVYTEVCENWSGEAADAFKAKIEEWKKIKEADEAAARTMQ